MGSILWWSGCSGSIPAYSLSAQVKAAVTHVRRLKRNQRQKINPESRDILSHSSSTIASIFSFSSAGGVVCVMPA